MLKKQWIFGSLIRSDACLSSCVLGDAAESVAELGTESPKGCCFGLMKGPAPMAAPSRASAVFSRNPVDAVSLVLGLKSNLNLCLFIHSDCFEVTKFAAFSKLGFSLAFGLKAYL